MRVLPSGSSGLLLELETLAEVLALYPALEQQRADGVVDLVPAARTVLVVIDPAVISLAATEAWVRQVRPAPGASSTGDLLEVPVVYDGEDLADVAELLGCSAAEVVERHSGVEWTVAFCGFAPGFGYLTAADGGWAVPRRASPRTRVPTGSVALAGEFSGVYPRQSPGGWQLIGRTELTVFDLDRDPPALLTPGTRVRFVEVAAG